MPCFKGLAVSIHTPDGPLPEHSIQRQHRASRMSSYIPVPPAKVPLGSATGKPEQSTFAISVTLLTPGLNVPYSTPKPTQDDPFPRPRVVSGLPGYTGERGRYGPTIPPYIPRTTNPNETIAAYIYFDGRAKEEVATLLRRGEETWVNSRWVSVPESEGGGLAEREFLFREVGLERWLNGLDLEGSKNKAEMIERRQRRLEKKRRKRKEQMGITSDDEEEDASGSKRVDRNGVLRYGGDGGSPVEDIINDEGLFSSDSDSEDEPPQAEAAGQIKVALFRVLASGEIKRGEYSPQFDAHDDDEANEQNGNTNGEGGDADIDHTTSFAKPKTLDPKSISTQTVTGLDPPEAPYAVFTFFYRGEKQLQKMGILTTPETPKTPLTSKRKSSGPDFSKLGPLQSHGTKGFSGYRDTATSKRKTKAKDEDAMDSDADDEDDGHVPDTNEDVEIKHENGNLLSPEDARRQGELAEGVQKIKLKRQHSAEPLTDASSTRKSPYMKTSESPTAGTPQSINSTSANAGTPPPDAMQQLATEPPETVGSPFKRHRASMPGLNNNIFGHLGSNTNDVFQQSATPLDEKKQQPATGQEVKQETKVESDEELVSQSQGASLTVRSRKLRGQPDKAYRATPPGMRSASARTVSSKRRRRDSASPQDSPSCGPAMKLQAHTGSSASAASRRDVDVPLLRLSPPNSRPIGSGASSSSSKKRATKVSDSEDLSLYEDSDIERQFGAPATPPLYTGNRISSESIRYSPL